MWMHGHDVMMGSYVMSACHNVMYDAIDDIIQHMPWAYNRPGATSWGGIPGSTPDG